MAVAVPAAAAALLAIDIAETVLVQIVGQLVAATLSAVLAPELEGLQVDAYGTIEQRLGSPPTPLSAPQAAQAVIRGYLSQAAGAAEAKFTGFNADRFKLMVDTSGQPLPLLTLAEAWRRGFIPKSGSGPDSISLEQGIRESDLKDKWIEVVEKLQYQLPPVGTIIEGWLRAQITPDQALKLANEAGIDNATATLMFKAAGRPPSPEELLTLGRRGVIPFDGTGGDTLSVNQGYLETDLKDKWYKPWLALQEYRPPPRTITALQRAGAITDEQALKLYQEEGLTPEMAAIYVKTAHRERVAATKELTKAEWVAMYTDQAITSDELQKRLATLGYTAEDTALEVQLADLKVAHALEQRAVNRVGTLYTGRKIDKAAAMSSLQSLKLPAPQIERLLTIWSLERGDNLRHLTPAEIGWLFKNNLMDEGTALDYLGILGYGSMDAWLVLSYESKLQLSTPMPSDNLPPV